MLCAYSQAVFVYYGGAPTFFLNRALLRLNPALSVVCLSVCLSVCHDREPCKNR